MAINQFTFPQEVCNIIQIHEDNVPGVEIFIHFLSFSAFCNKLVLTYFWPIFNVLSASWLPDQPAHFWEFNSWGGVHIYSHGKIFTILIRSLKYLNIFPLCSCYRSAAWQLKVGTLFITTCLNHDKGLRLLVRF